MKILGDLETTKTTVGIGIFFGYNSAISEKICGMDIIQVFDHKTLQD